MTIIELLVYNTVNKKVWSDKEGIMYLSPSRLYHLRGKWTLDALLGLLPTDNYGALLYPNISTHCGQKDCGMGEHGGCRRLERPLVDTPRFARLQGHTEGRHW